MRVQVRPHAHKYERKSMIDPAFMSCSYIGCNAAQRTKPALAQEHSRPSREAAAKAEGFRTSQQRMIWEFLASHEDGRTTEEICIALGLDGSTVRPRLVELDEQGRITRLTKNGQPYHHITNKDVATRPNTKGNRMTVWTAVR